MEVLSADHWKDYKTDTVADKRRAVKDLNELLGWVRKIPVAGFPFGRWIMPALHQPFDPLWNRYVRLMCMEIDNANEGHFGWEPYTDDELQSEWRLSGLPRPVQPVGHPVHLAGTVLLA